MITVPKVQSDLLSLPNASNEDLASSLVRQVRQQDDINLNFHIDQVNGDYYDVLAGGDRFGEASFARLEPVDVGAKMFGYADDSVDNESQKLFLPDPYTTMAGSDNFYDAAYPDAGYSMKVLGATGTGMYKLLSNANHGLQYAFLYREVRNILEELSMIRKAGPIGQAGLDSLGMGSGEAGPAVSSVSSYNYENEMSRMASLESVLSVDSATRSNISNILGVAAPSISYPLNVLFSASVVSAFSDDKFKDHIANVVLETNTSFATRAVLSKVFSVLDVTNPVFAVGATLGLKAAVTEALEVAAGLDRSYGFGGQRIGGSLVDGTATYGRDIGLLEGIRDVAVEIATLGIADTYTFNTFQNDVFQATLSGELSFNQDFDAGRSSFDSTYEGLMGGTFGGISAESISSDFSGINTISQVGTSFNDVYSASPGIAGFSLGSEDFFGSIGVETSGDDSGITDAEYDELGFEQEYAGSEFQNSSGGFDSVEDAQGYHEAQAEAAADAKIVCTAMNKAYGFGSFRNKVWLKYSASMTKEHEIGYHTLFKPLVELAYDKNATWLRSVLEHIAVHRTLDIRAEMRGGDRHWIGRIERAVLEPMCFFVGRAKIILRRFKI